MSRMRFGRDCLAAALCTLALAGSTAPLMGAGSPASSDIGGTSSVPVSSLFKPSAASTPTKVPVPTETPTPPPATSTESSPVPAGPEGTLVAGPETSTVATKGAMVRALTAESLDRSRAHQLRFSFHPVPEAQTLKVKLYAPDGRALTTIPLGKGRTAILDLDPGPDGLQVMVEEQGVLEEPVKIVATLYEYPAGYIPPDVKPAAAAPTLVASSPASAVPDTLVTSYDLDGKAPNGRRGVAAAMKRLKLTRQQAQDFALAMENAEAWLKKSDLAAAHYFLGRAEAVAPAAEVSFWRGLVEGTQSAGAGAHQLAESLRRFEKGASAAELMGTTVPKMNARVHAVAAAGVLRLAAVPGADRSVLETAKLRGDFERHLSRAEALDPEGSRDVVALLRSKWKAALEARSAAARAGGSAAPATTGAVEGADGVEPGVFAFLEARKAFVGGNRDVALRALDAPGLPTADALYLKAEILLSQGRKEGARAALVDSIAAFEAGDCLAGADGGTVPGTVGVVPPADVRAALARVSLARYWGEKFKERSTDARADRVETAAMLERAVTLVEKALGAVPSQREWATLANAYREERLKYLYPTYKVGN